MFKPAFKSFMPPPPPEGYQVAQPLEEPVKEMSREEKFLVVAIDATKSMVESCELLGDKVGAKKHKKEMKKLQKELKDLQA